MKIFKHSIPALIIIFCLVCYSFQATFAQTFNYFAGTNAGAGNTGHSNTIGINNTANGYQALYQNTSGDYNTANGYHALYRNTTGQHNTANGTGALYSNTNGSYNSANGQYSLYSNTVGVENTANGAYSLYHNIAGSNNAANGYYALYSNTSGNFNVSNGNFSLLNNTTGNNNTANGVYALFSNTNSSNNTADGFYALYDNSTGNENVASGDSSLYNNTAGYNNVADGGQALFYNTTGNNNTAIGFLAGPTSAALSNTTALGHKAIPTASNQVRVGNASITSIGGQVSWTNFSDARIKNNIKENVPGLAFINLLHPVTYHFNIAKENEMLGIKDSDDDKVADAEIEKINFTGFLAQDVDKAAQKINYDFSGVDKTGSVMGLRYSDFVVPLVKAVQELSKKNDELQNEIDQLKAVITSNQSSAVNQQSIAISSASLAQNIPNPFNNTTTINYSIPQQFNSAKIIVTDKNGSAIKTITLSGGSKGSVKIDASTMAGGAYQYSLYVNNKLIDTKQMISAK